MKEDKEDNVPDSRIVAETRSKSSTANVTRQYEEQFINTFRKLPELWNTEHEHYTNKQKRNAALDVLLKILHKWNPSANRDKVRQKINILRSVYRKDLRKHLASKRYTTTGEVTYDYEPKNWKFHALRFLDTDKSDRNAGLIEINLDDSSFENTVTSESSFENEEPTSYQAPVDFNGSGPVLGKHPLEQKNSKIKVQDAWCQENEIFDSELEAIGANVTCKLKRMNPEQRNHAELLINRVLIIGLKNNLTDNTDLSEVPPSSS